MKKTFKMEGVDCANCARKMGEAIAKLPGVTNAAVNFLTQKLTIEVEDGADLDGIVKQAVKCCKKVDPDCEVYI